MTKTDIMMVCHFARDLLVGDGHKTSIEQHNGEKLNVPNPDLSSLFASRPSSPDIDYTLAARYAPILKFDAREPFLPIVVGYNIFRKNTISPAFPRQIEVSEVERPEPLLATEYTIWWDWDIVHLYELEHIWLFIDKKGQVVRGEASWHGEYKNMGTNGSLPLSDNRLTWFQSRASMPLLQWAVGCKTRLKKHGIFAVKWQALEGY